MRRPVPSLDPGALGVLDLEVILLTHARLDEDGVVLEGLDLVRVRVRGRARAGAGVGG